MLAGFTKMSGKTWVFASGDGRCIEKSKSTRQDRKPIRAEGRSQRNRRSPPQLQSQGGQIAGAPGAVPAYSDGALRFLGGPPKCTSSYVVVPSVGFCAPLLTHPGTIVSPEVTVDYVWAGAGSGCNFAVHP